MMGPKERIVLYGVLNWGLGHATRSIPVIRSLIASGFRPVICSDGAPLLFLQKEFPQLAFEKLPAYGIRYGRGSSLPMMLVQAPQIFRAAWREHRLLKKLVRKYRPVGIISDNRLGFCHPNITSVYITHQLKLMLPFARRLMSRWHHLFIQKYDECWVPDLEGQQNLSGEMGHCYRPSVPVKYMGILSRFAQMKLPSGDTAYRACAILSGPEPQRSLLEKKLLQQMADLPGRFLIIRGTVRGSLNAPENVVIENMAGIEEIARAVRSSRIVISRSGYSSLMDYAHLRNKALLIPTPGQPEQEYLARYMLHKGHFLYVSQSHLNLAEDLEKAENYDGLKGFGEGKDFPVGLFSLFEGKGKG